MLKNVGFKLVLVLSLLFISIAFAETEYFAVYFEGKKAGYSIHSREVAGDMVTTKEEMVLKITRLGQPMNIKTTETCVETKDGKPVSFESIQDMSVMLMKISGTVTSDGMVNLSSNVAGSQQNTQIKWPQDAVMSEGLRILEQKAGLKTDGEFTAIVFVPSLQQAYETKVHVGKKQDIDLLGRIVSLTEVTSTMKMPGMGEVAVKSYVNDSLNVLKSIMPIAGMQIEIVAAPKDFAMGNLEAAELQSKMFIPSPQPIQEIGGILSIKYHIVPVQAGKDFNMPSTDLQKAKKLDDGSYEVTVQNIEAEKGAAFPYSGKDAAILEALKPNRYIQSDDPKIIALAKEAVGDTKDAAEAVKKIEEFVGKYIQSKNFSVGYASALEVVASKQGDCSEFAVLTAALCRASGIPAQVAAGLAYVDSYQGMINQFGGHAWVQAYVGDKWVGIDSAFKGTGRGGFDAGHIAFAVGNGTPEDLLGMINILGQIKIDKIEITDSN